MLRRIKIERRKENVGKSITGLHDGVWGDFKSVTVNVSRIRGDVTHIYGYVSDRLRDDVTHISGDVTGVAGDATELSGDVENHLEKSEIPAVHSK